MESLIQNAGHLEKEISGTYLSESHNKDTKLIESAKHYLSLGLNPIPCNADKTPIGTWKHLETEKNNPANFQYAAKIGIVCGKISKLTKLMI